ncbi:YlmC/YmxH family sporulation protein [Tepidibacter formicigenes]|jgi:YlmC/YmxH family sporulation protein|uniref:Sporulation protein, YlmC/YmxH family n=1 Tax=Tepidibacter formicigenes DSM 15518 TaxID=1123349 RepID=A0A1M6KD46_9FIRM|nr:YlmC/YmxH family sporulation protein [Tepidibacter formicigenes]SHJ56831.1 sporulation protein, YlmC/YmxH family [Tepidibacter formicigenes DSM 15518]
MFKISEMMEKEVVNVNNGKKLGFINDIELDMNEGKIRSLIIFNENSKLYLLGRGEVYSIFWNDIVKVGCDTILVKIDQRVEFNNIDI